MRQLEQDINLQPLNSFGIKARANYFFAFEKTTELHDFFERHPEFCDNFKVLSGGNNVLLTHNPEQLIIHPCGKNITLNNDNTITVDTGVEWDDLVSWCVENSLWGLENLSLIPGYVGAAPVQNIGAYGSEVKDCLTQVEIYLPKSRTTKILTASECQFGYRDSIFKNELKDKAIITAVSFKLSTSPSPQLSYSALKQQVEAKGEPSLKNIREVIIQTRESKLPDPKVLGNAGSFFKNPVAASSLVQSLKQQYPSMPTYPTDNENYLKIAAGWLIEQAGWKGRKIGNIGVHESQALVIVNHSKQTKGTEILDFANKVADDVYAKFGVKIQMEVNIW